MVFRSKALNKEGTDMEHLFYLVIRYPTVPSK